MNLQKVPKHLECLASAIFGGDISAWEPLVDAVIEFGYPNLVAYHCWKPSCVECPWACDLVLYFRSTYFDKDILDREEKSAQSIISRRKHDSAI